MLGLRLVVGALLQAALVCSPPVVGLGSVLDVLLPPCPPHWSLSLYLPYGEVLDLRLGVLDVDRLVLVLHIVPGDACLLCPPRRPPVVLGRVGCRLLPLFQRAPCPPSARLDSTCSGRVCGAPVSGILHESHFSLPYFLCVDLLGLHGSCAGSLPLGTGHLGLVPLVGRKLLRVQALAGDLALDHQKCVVAPPLLVAGIIRGFVVGHVPTASPRLLAASGSYQQCFPIYDWGLQPVLAPLGLAFVCAP